MTPLFYDRAQISGKARITPEGYFVADALVGKANNIQEYRAAELGITDRNPNDIVRVFRPAAEVFAVDSLKTASRLPITVDHPVKDGAAVMVDAGNWREFAKGETGEEILRDGDFIRVPIRVTDAAGVSAVQRDHQEFSLGYAAKIELTPGVHDGQEYDASLSTIRYNHLAACVAARGGSELRITDERTLSPVSTVGVLPVTTAIVDGVPVNLADATAAKMVVDKLVADRDSAVLDNTAHLQTIATRDAELVTKGEEITRLTDELAKAKLTTAQLRDAAASHAKTLADAKRLGVAVTDEMNADDARKAAVSAKLGDKAANYTDEQTAIAFDTLVVGLDNGATPPVRDALGEIIGDATNVTDAAAKFNTARNARFNRFETAHKGAAIGKEA